jgi:predicted PurR-regulated permease PerM
VAIFLTIICLFVLLAGCYLVLREFMNAVIWAAILCFSTWPIYSWLARRLGNRPTLAATVMMILVVLVVVIPVTLLGMSMAHDVEKMAKWVQSLLREGAPAPPSWLAKIPLVGKMVEAYWSDLAQDTNRPLELLEGFLKNSKNWFLARGKELVVSLFELGITLFVAFFFYKDGESIGRKARNVLSQVTGPHTQNLLDVVGGTAKGVVYGVLGTALAQGTLAAVGFWITGVPMALLLGMLTFFLSLIPMGPPLVWIPASFWLICEGSLGWGIFMALWGLLVVSSVDNFLKPYLISRGSNLPFALVFLGVLGGLVAFGPIGVFLGPILLAVGYTLLKVWGSEEGERV